MSEGLFGKNYFEIFNCAVAYDIDLNAVSGLYRELQKSVHPDRYAHASDQEKRMAMQQTSLINQAFQTLKDSVSRAQYMLQLAGVDTHAETETTMDAEFLMEQMEIRETISEVREKQDPLAELDKLESVLKKKFMKLAQDFGAQFSQQSLNAARETVRKMQFVAKAQTEIKELSEELENEIL